MRYQKTRDKTTIKYAHGVQLLIHFDLFFNRMLTRMHVAQHIPLHSHSKVKTILDLCFLLQLTCLAEATEPPTPHDYNISASVTFIHYPIEK